MTSTIYLASSLSKENIATALLEFQLMSSQRSIFKSFFTRKKLEVQPQAPKKKKGSVETENPAQNQTYQPNHEPWTAPFTGRAIPGSKYLGSPLIYLKPPKNDHLEGEKAISRGLTITMVNYLYTKWDDPPRGFIWAPPVRPKHPRGRLDRPESSGCDRHLRRVGGVGWVG